GAGPGVWLARGLWRARIQWRSPAVCHQPHGGVDCFSQCCGEVFLLPWAIRGSSCSLRKNREERCADWWLTGAIHPGDCRAGRLCHRRQWLGTRIPVASGDLIYLVYQRRGLWPDLPAGCHQLCRDGAGEPLPRRIQRVRENYRAAARRHWHGGGNPADSHQLQPHDGHRRLLHDLDHAGHHLGIRAHWPYLGRDFNPPQHHELRAHYGQGRGDRTGTHSTSVATYPQPPSYTHLKKRKTQSCLKTKLSSSAPDSRAWLPRVSCKPLELSMKSWKPKTASAAVPGPKSAWVVHWNWVLPGCTGSKRTPGRKSCAMASAQKSRLPHLAMKLTGSLTAR